MKAKSHIVNVFEGGGTGIIGGRPILHSETFYSFFIPWIYTPNSLCTGVVIKSQYVLTAAHCVLGQKPNNVLVTFKTEDFYQSYEVKNIIAHPNFGRALNIIDDLVVKDFLENDIAILELEKGDLPLPNSMKLGGLSLLYKAQGYVEVFGYGITGLFGKDSKYHSDLNEIQLRRANIKVSHVDPALSPKWFARYRRVADLNSSRYFSGICYGDSGGPVFVVEDTKLFLVGLSQSVAPDCSQRATFFVLIESYRSWIESVTGPLEWVN